MIVTIEAKTTKIKVAMARNSPAFFTSVMSLFIWGFLIFTDITVRATSNPIAAKRISKAAKILGRTFFNA